MKLCLILSVLFLGCNSQDVIDRINAEDNVFFTGYNPTAKNDFLQFAPADPANHTTKSDGDFNTTLLVFTQERESAQYWGMTASYEAKKVWANNMRSAHLKEFDFDTGRVKTVTRDLTNGLENLAYDRITKILYWTDSINMAVRAIELTYCHYTNIHISTACAPYGIVVHPVLRKLFISCYETKNGFISKTEITKCDLDGSNRQTILKFPDVLRPRDMTIDFANDLLFWTDTTFDRRSVVMASDFSGIRKRQFFEKSTSYLWGIAYYKGWIYTTDIVNTTDNKYEIHVRKTVGSQSYTKVSARRPRNVAIYAPDETATIKISNECDGNNCDHMCLASGKGGFVCKCSPGYKLSKGNKCVTEPLKDNYLLVSDLGQKRVFHLPIRSSASSAGDMIALDIDESFQGSCYRKFAVSTIKKTGGLAWYDIRAQEIVWGSKRLSFKQGVYSVTSGCCNKKVYWHTASTIYSWDGITSAKAIYSLSFFSDSQIRKIAVDCKESRMYWVEYDSFQQTAKVSRSSLAGRDVEIVLRGIANTFTLTIDYENYTLHVVTTIEGVLYSIPLKDIRSRIVSTSPFHSGYKRTNLKPHMINKSFLIYGITVVNGYVYLADDINDMILRFNMKMGPSSMERYGENQVFFATSIDFYSKSHYEKYMRPICDPGYTLTTATTTTASTTTTTTTTDSAASAPTADCFSQYMELLKAGLDRTSAFNFLFRCLFGG